MSRPILTILLSLAIAQSALAVPNTASQGDRIRSISVRLDDLNLRNDTDVQVLLGRLNRAAVRACGGNPKFHPTYALVPRFTTKVFQECRHEAIARAVATIDAPKVSVAFEAASKKAAQDEWAHLTHSSDATPKAGT
jgi:UrcA family protein